MPPILKSIPSIIMRTDDRKQEERARQLVARAFPKLNGPTLDVWVDLVMREVAKRKEESAVVT